MNCVKEYLVLCKNDSKRDFDSKNILIEVYSSKYGNLSEIVLAFVRGKEESAHIIEFCDYLIAATQGFSSDPYGFKDCDSISSILERSEKVIRGILL